MRQVLVGTAFLTSLLAFVLTAGSGLFLAGVEQSGERRLGVVLAAAGVVAFGAVLLLVFAPPALFRRPLNRALAVVATVLGLAPLAALAAAALFFVGSPFGSAIPRLDWALFVLGLVFALGAASVAALGYLRTTGRAPREPERPEGSLYAPLAAAPARSRDDADRSAFEIDDDVRVRRA